MRKPPTADFLSEVYPIVKKKTAFYKSFETTELTYRGSYYIAISFFSKQSPSNLSQSLPSMSEGSGTISETKIAHFFHLNF